MAWMRCCSTRSTNRQIVSLEETHIFSPTLVNSARGGFSREYELNNKGVGFINPLAKDPSLAAIPGQFAAHVIGSIGMTSSPAV